jgi:hypothetical protein
MVPSGPKTRRQGWRPSSTAFTPSTANLDDYATSEPNWSPGDVLYAGGVPAYKIRQVIPLGDLDNEVYQGIWEVEPV